MPNLKSRPRLALTSIALALAAALVASSMAVAHVGPRAVSVVVREEAGSGHGPEDAVQRLGGHIGRRIGLIRGFEATVPAEAVVRLESEPGVASVSHNARVTLAAGPAGDYDPAADLGSLESIARSIGADEYWAEGYTGEGVDIAVIDSGVAPVKGLTGDGKVVNGPDLSFESQDRDLRYLDTYGHGTHMAGIIAGSDSDDDDDSEPGLSPAHDDDPGNGFHGIAPGARIVSLKVADAFGATDVVQVLIAIDWVVKHRRDGDLDIRVLNLSFGTDATQDYRIDPLAYAVEMAWRRGIFVVVAAGNQGYGSSKLNAPAYDPFIMAVGASDPNGTRTRTDDTVASLSSRGVASRRPDLLAPGRSVASLRTPGSFIDTRYPGGRVGPDPARFFRGSGTSQAAAVVSGAAALVIDQRDRIRPDQLKRLLMETAYELPAADPLSQGEGLLDLGAALGTPTPIWVQTWLRATGQGTLEGSRGSHHLSDGGVKLKGEIDIFGLGFDAGRWAVRANGGTSFTGGKWMGRSWTGDCWCSDSWSGTAWQGRSWTTGTWTGRSWTSASWTGRSWTSTGWTGGAWTGRSWTSSSWHGDVWSSSDWGP